MQTENYLDRLIPVFTQWTPPANSSDVTRAEINALVNLLATPRKEKHVYFDEALLVYIREYFVSAGADEAEIQKILNDIAEDVLPLITKLKYHFQRPRPSTLAYYMNVQLLPDSYYFANTPSFPSAHTTMTAITCEVLGNIFPQSYSRMIGLRNEVLESRLFLGVHYSSDNDMAMAVAKRVLENPEFKLRMKI